MPEIHGAKIAVGGKGGVGKTTVSAILAQLLGGGLGVGIFVFTMLAWGNALEVRGNMIEWKHIMLVLVISLLIVTWSGILAFPITVGGSFGFIAYTCYASK